MNILYVTNLSENKWAGPNISVPSQIKAQSVFDNVFMYNQNHLESKEWRKLEYFNNLNDFPTQKLKDLPKPFNMPDLIIFEGMYHFALNKFAKDIYKMKIPYIIIPRSELTKQAQKQKFLKKKIANFIWFNKFCKNALSIQYLTKAEYIDSGDKWNKNYIIIPNGIDKKKNTKIDFNRQMLKLVYIGRLDMYHKGLDIMLQAILKVQNNLRQNYATVHLYGPDRNDTVSKLKNIIKKNKIDDIVFIHESVFGDEKEKILLDADIFIMTSRFEGHPMGLIEALSYGIPCLVSTGTNMGEEIKNINAGWVSEVNKDNISIAINKALNNKTKLKQKGKNALSIAKNYNWDTLAESSSKEYKKLLESLIS